VTPMAKVLQDAFGIERAFMTTVHAYTHRPRRYSTALTRICADRAPPRST
jgi:glyceraldehyde-3-phosphate dehydrogenase/erythrose-4-phosphate dehydrogenase